MDTQKFTPKQLLVIFAVNVVASVVAGYILYQLTKPKADTATSASPTAIKPASNTVTPVTTTTPTTTTTEA